MALVNNNTLILNKIKDTCSLSHFKGYWVDFQAIKRVVDIFLQKNADL